MMIFAFFAFAIALFGDNIYDRVIAAYIEVKSLLGFLLSSIQIVHGVGSCYNAFLSKL